MSQRLSSTHMDASMGGTPADPTNKPEALSVLSNDNTALLSKSQKRQRKQSSWKEHKGKIAFVSILIILLIGGGITIWYFYFDNIHGDDEQQTYNDGPPGLFGQWPIYGGNLQNQQISPFQVNITSENIGNVEHKCSYFIEGGRSFDGYIVIDDDNNAYFPDYTGYITCVNLDSCNEVWRKNINELLGLEVSSTTTKLVSRNSVTLYIDNATHRKSVLLGTPNKRRESNLWPIDNDHPCYLLSLDARTGDLIWSIDLSTDDPKETYACQAHGFIVDTDGMYAYGGVSVFAWTPPGDPQDLNFNQFKGRLMKVDLITHEIINEFWTIPKDKNDGITNSNGYIGGGIWNFPAMLDDYIVFGSGDSLNTRTPVDNAWTTNAYRFASL